MENSNINKVRMRVMTSSPEERRINEKLNVFTDLTVLMYQKRLIQIASYIAYFNKGKSGLDVLNYTFNYIRENFKYDKEYYRKYRSNNGGLRNDRLSLKPITITHPETGRKYSGYYDPCTNFSALITGYTVCHGFANLVRDICNILKQEYNFDIECRVVITEIHAFNEIKVGNKIYHFDVSNCLQFDFNKSNCLYEIPDFSNINNSESQKVNSQNAESKSPVLRLRYNPNAVPRNHVIRLRRNPNVESRSSVLSLRHDPNVESRSSVLRLHHDPNAESRSSVLRLRHDPNAESRSPVLRLRHDPNPRRSNH